MVAVTALEQLCRMSVGECIDAAHGMMAKRAERDVIGLRMLLADCAEADAAQRGVSVGEVLAGWVCDAVERAET